MAWGNQYRSAGSSGGSGMNTVNVFLTVILVAVVVYILFRPGNNTSEVIHALGKGSSTLTRTLSGQYAGGEY